MGLGLLSKVTSGFVERPQVNTFMGIPGVGKTTIASQFPNSIFADFEDGSGHLNVSRVGKEDLAKFEDFQSFLTELAESDHEFQTLNIDTADSLESLIQKHVCDEGGVDTIERYDGGFGKGYTRSREIITDVMRNLQALRDKRHMTINILAHVQVRTVTDPATNMSYDRYILRTNDKFGSIIRDLSDNVFFATHSYFTKKDGQKTMAFGDGSRVMFTEWRPAFDAKNRLNLPFEIEFSYQALQSAIREAKPKTPDEIRKEVKALMKAISDEELKGKITQAIETAGDDLGKLSGILNRVREKAQNN